MILDFGFWIVFVNFNLKSKIYNLKFSSLFPIPYSLPQRKDFLSNPYIILMGSTSIVKLTEAGQSFLISSQSGKLGSASGANFNSICQR